VWPRADNPGDVHPVLLRELLGIRRRNAFYRWRRWCRGGGGGVGMGRGLFLAMSLGEGLCARPRQRDLLLRLGEEGDGGAHGSGPAGRDEDGCDDPSWNVSTSMSALSDSTTTTGSPLATRSPSAAVQETIFPSVIVELSAGMNISRTFARTTATVLRRGRGTPAAAARPRRARPGTVWKEREGEASDAMTRLSGVRTQEGRGERGGGGIRRPARRRRREVGRRTGALGEGGTH